LQQSAFQVGDSIEVKGPLSKMKYSPNMKKSIGMVAGGTGITPMLQVIQEILKNPADHTSVHLVFANDKEEDILLKATLDTLAAKHKNFKVTYVLAKPSAAWKGHKGYVGADLLHATMPKPSADSLVLVCGPPGFMEAVSGGKTPDYKQGEVKGLLKAAGFNEDNVFKF
jgi:cytochrome-b5 reductase